MGIGRIAREGFVGGMLGAAAVAGWFFAVDAVAGQVFRTPALLGQALLFGGVSDPAAVSVTFPTVIGYTMVHVLVFVVVGMLAAVIACQIERAPTTLFLAIVLFAVIQFGFYAVVATIAEPLLGALAWTNVAVGNSIAALAMGIYLWRAHPRMKENLARQPLGSAED